MADEDPGRRLAELEARIAAAKGSKPVKPHTEEHYSQAHLAWRMVIELVAGIAIGFGIGLGLDALFGTRPVFLVLFILLGFAAGVKTMLRSARELQTAQSAGDGDRTRAGDGRNEG